MFRGSKKRVRKTGMTRRVHTGKPAGWPKVFHMLFVRAMKAARLRRSR